MGGARQATCWALRAKRWLSRRGHAAGPSEDACTTAELGEESGLGTERLVGSAEPGRQHGQDFGGGPYCRKTQSRNEPELGSLTLD